MTRQPIWAGCNFCARCKGFQHRSLTMCWSIDLSHCNDMWGGAQAGAPSSPLVGARLTQEWQGFRNNLSQLFFSTLNLYLLPGWFDSGIVRHWQGQISWVWKLLKGEKKNPVSHVFNKPASRVGTAQPAASVTPHHSASLLHTLLQKHHTVLQSYAAATLTSYSAEIAPPYASEGCTTSQHTLARAGPSKRLATLHSTSRPGGGGSRLALAQNTAFLGLPLPGLLCTDT